MKIFNAKDAMPFNSDVVKILPCLLKLHRIDFLVKDSRSLGNLNYAEFRVLSTPFIKIIFQVFETYGQNYTSKIYDLSKIHVSIRIKKSVKYFLKRLTEYKSYGNTYALGWLTELQIKIYKLYRKYMPQRKY